MANGLHIESLDCRQTFTQSDLDMLSELWAMDGGSDSVASFLDLDLEPVTMFGMDFGSMPVSSFGFTSTNGLTLAETDNLNTTHADPSNDDEDILEGLLSSHHLDSETARNGSIEVDTPSNVTASSSSLDDFSEDAISTHETFGPPQDEDDVEITDGKISPTSGIDPAEVTQPSHDAMDHQNPVSSFDGSITIPSHATPIDLTKDDIDGLSATTTVKKKPRRPETTKSSDDIIITRGGRQEHCSAKDHPTLHSLLIRVSRKLRKDRKTRTQNSQPKASREKLKRAGRKGIKQCSLGTELVSVKAEKIILYSNVEFKWKHSHRRKEADGKGLWIRRFDDGLDETWPGEVFLSMVEDASVFVRVLSEWPLTQMRWNKETDLFEGEPTDDMRLTIGWKNMIALVTGSGGSEDGFLEFEQD